MTDTKVRNRFTAEDTALLLIDHHCTCLHPGSSRD